MSLSGDHLVNEDAEAKLLCSTGLFPHYSYDTLNDDYATVGYSESLAGAGMPLMLQMPSLQRYDAAIAALCVGSVVVPSPRTWYDYRPNAGAAMAASWHCNWGICNFMVMPAPGRDVLYPTVA